VALEGRDLLMKVGGRGLTRLWIGFGVSSLAFLAVLAVSPVKDYFREYRRYQNEYRERLLETAASSRELKDARAQGVRVHQIWLPEFGNRVDRCVTCHLGVRNPRMADAPTPYRRHVTTPHTPADLDRFGCVACHRGQGRATSLAEAHGEAPGWDSPLLPLPYTEAACGSCHLEDTVPEASLLSEGRKLMNEYGCFGCHELEGRTDWKSTAPELNGLSLKTRPEWLKAFLDEPRRMIPNTRMPDFELTSGEIDSLVAFLWSVSSGSDPTVAVDDSLPPGDPDRGMQIFRASRCVSCHTIGGRGNGSAPELEAVGSKVNRPWLVAYLEDPHAFQPRTRMPAYRFDRQDLLDLSQYMIGDLIDPSFEASEEPYRASRKAVLAGERIYRQYGCTGCHRIEGRDDPPQVAPVLTGIGEKPVGLLDFGGRDDLPRSLPDWLAAKVTDPRSFREGLRMPRFGLEPEQVEAVVTALLSCVRKPVPEDYRVERRPAAYDPPGRFGDLVDRYRCLSCHMIHGSGGDISTAPLTEEGSRVTESWLASYLQHPFTIRPILTDRMVPLGMSKEESSFLTEFIQNVYVNDEVQRGLFAEGPPADRVDRGRRLYFERYGCQACHMIGGRGGFYGPLLDGAGERLKAGWIAWWLRGPQRWRADVRCPDFGIGETDARDLAAYLVSLGMPESGEGSGDSEGGDR
jgi:mono/diheme cytochrome c family protein